MHPRPLPTTRPLLITMAITNIIGGLLAFAAANVTTLYLLGPPFHLHSVPIGNFVGLQSLAASFGSIAFVKPLEMCGLSDLVIVMISIISAGIGVLALGLAHNTAILFTSKYTLH